MRAEKARCCNPHTTCDACSLQAALLCRVLRVEESNGAKALLHCVVLEPLQNHLVALLAAESPGIVAEVSMRFCDFLAAYAAGCTN